MNRFMKYAVTCIALAAVLGASTGCTRVRLQDDPKTRTFTESNSIDLKGAAALKATIDQGVGELRVRPSVTATPGVVDTTFMFAPESWRPEVTSAVEGTAATLEIAMPNGASSPTFANTKNTWTITLPKGVATDLSLQLGVGLSQVDLRGLNLTGLDVKTGVGETTIDLSGPRTTDLASRIEAGVGALTLRLPRNVGVRITSDNNGIGHWSAKGFTESGTGFLTNSAWSGTGPKIDIELDSGVGDVTLVLVD